MRLGSQQSLVVVAQTGTRLAVPAGSPAGTLGALSHETDSQAVQITANVTGSRSINAMNALTGTTALGDPAPLAGADAAIADIVQAAGIFNGFVGSARPTLQTDGNFTAVDRRHLPNERPVQRQRADRADNCRISGGSGRGGSTASAGSCS